MACDEIAEGLSAPAVQSLCAFLDDLTGGGGEGKAKGGREGRRDGERERAAEGGGGGRGRWGEGGTGQ